MKGNRDVVRYLASFLRQDYKLAVAENGAEDLAKALEQIPDLILSDVMMPGMDGFELCDTLKKEMRTSHIPVILLTARADQSSRIEGLERGADAYLAKPFHQRELLVRLQKLRELRAQLRERYRALSTIPPSYDRDIQIEDAFMQKIREILEAYLVDENFGVPDLCRALGMSRAQLYRKFRALAGQPVMHYFRSLRLLKAKTLLQTTGLHISEIAYEVGFKDLAHFTRALAEEFGMSPTEAREG